MHSNYGDIRTRITEQPTWYDQSGCPRYGPFDPEMCPNIYAREVVLLEIACQYCKREFLVEMHDSGYTLLGNPTKLHYGDPPAHGCTGDTMNCDDLQVVEVWCKSPFPHLLEWERHPELEGEIA